MTHPVNKLELCSFVVRMLHSSMMGIVAKRCFDQDIVSVKANFTLLLLLMLGSLSSNDSKAVRELKEILNNNISARGKAESDKVVSA